LRPPEPFFPEALVPALFGLLVIPVVIFMIRMKWKSIYSGTPYFKYPISGELSSEGFSGSSQRGTANIPWSDITGFKSNKTVIIIYQGPLLFHVIARNFFSSSQDWESAKQIIVQAINQPS
jgi:hypothetical protein